MLGKLGLRFIILALFLCLIIFVGIEIDFAARVHRLGVVSILLSPLVPSISIFAAGICLWFGLPTVAYWNLARRAVSDVLRITQGRCFEVLPAPSIYLFARIGPTSESAAWYPLPIEWETVVMPSEDTYEVEYLPTSGWVHRVRRFGASPREVVQRAPSEVNDGAHAAAVEEEVEAQPTAEEQRELRRYARRVWRFWGESAASIAASGWSLIVLGVVAGHGMVAAFLWLYSCGCRPFVQCVLATKQESRCYWRDAWPLAADS